MTPKLVSMPMATAQVDANGRLSDLHLSSDFTFWGEVDEFESRSLSELLPPGVFEEVLASIQDVLSNDGVRSFDYAAPIDSEERVHEGHVIGTGDDEAFLILQDITSRKRAEEALVQSREQLRSLAGYLESVREEERKKIARDVHDVLGQELTALRIDVSSIKDSLPAAFEDLRERVDLVNDSIRSIIQTVRRIASDLRPGILDDLGIVAALEWQTDDFSKRAGISCNFEHAPDEMKLGPDRSTALFRIFQEILTNIVRHAEASVVWVKLEQRDGSLVLRVKDNGRGIREEEISNVGSLGLVGIRERLLPWNGTVEFAGMPEHGTTVTVVMPLGTPEPAGVETDLV